MTRKTVTELHREWLELVDTDGPFLAVPPLKRVYENGIPQPDAEALATLKDAKPAFESAWEKWDTHRDDEAALAAYRDARDGWVETVLRDVISWGEDYATAVVEPTVTSPNNAVAVRPSGALIHGAATGALLLVVDPVDSLRDPADDGWAVSPIDRMAELLRAGGVPIGVVTDGRWWAIVSHRAQTMLASGIVDAHTWIEEPTVRNAVIELLSRKRLIGGDLKDRLTELFGESVAAAEEITEALGVQVRRAVELLVRALSEAGTGALPERRAEVYEAAVTVMMRVVFLLFAEERNLLPQSSLFTGGYGISGELDALDARAREETSEALDGTQQTWHRLLATSQAIYRGASFEDLRLPAYGGSLFDPARFAWLTACTEHGTLAITVSDRVMLEVLASVQVAAVQGEARRISFRDIDVEQIGYIYEGLLGYSCAEVGEVTVGLGGKPGEEPEMPLAELEALRHRHRSDAALAEAILAWVKEHQPAAKPQTKAKLTKGFGEKVEDAEQALRAVTTDDGLRDRLHPFVGVIRRDLRQRPLVVAPGGLLVVETPSRATAGAHYTPRSLAEEVVTYALQPLVFDPGPHDTPDEQAWRPISSDQILDLKIADIACGSGAFLVAGARYLAARLVEAWGREGVASGTPHELFTRAVREVVATCIYGADINGMAVEMCKLSLWLVSLDKRLPFSFVDDKILHGNSLLGLTDERQLKRQHINPDAASGQFDVFGLDVDEVLDKAVRLRRQLATEVNDDDPQRSATTKRRQWARYQELTAQLSDVADGVIAAGLRLGGKPGKALREAYENLGLAVGQAYPSGGGEANRRMLDDILREGLTPTVETDYERWKPLHWILAVPDVMERGGFDAVVGNPPFLGGKKVSPAIGQNMREWLINQLAGGQKGNADLVAYFFLRATSLLDGHGNLGLIATNTVAQGDTREVGLDQTAHNFTITRAIHSRSWPAATANLEYAAVWGSLGEVAKGVERVADDVAVERISTLLEPAGRVDGVPSRLTENAGVAFIGCYVLGMGFVVEPEEAGGWIETNPKNKEVLFPYLGGEDLNSQPNASPSRWVIDFNERSEQEAKQFPQPWLRVDREVRPERSEKDAKKYPRMVYEWWKFFNSRPAMRTAISGMPQVLVMAQTSNTLQPVLVPSRQVFSHKIVVFASNSPCLQAVLSSSMHYLWARRYSSSLRTDLSYTPSDSFLTFPRPKPTDRLAEIGRTLDTERREIMLRRELGLTKLYNRVNDPDVADSADPDVARMREIHVELDHAVMEAYNWGDVPLEHGFHTYRQMRRWTVSPTARAEILDRLLAENHRRAAAQGEAPPPAAPDEDGDEQ
jgi:type I restriction-modification system DNA methylase subunit